MKTKSFHSTYTNPRKNTRVSMFFSVNRLEINDTLWNKESVVYCLLIHNFQRYFSQHKSSIKWNYFVNAIFAREIVF